MQAVLHHTAAGILSGSEQSVADWVAEWLEFVFYKM